MSNGPSPGGALSVPTWQELYRNAFLELDHEKVFGRIIEARDAIHERAKQLRFGSPHSEGRELTDALRSLDSLEAVVTREKSA